MYLCTYEKCYAIAHKCAQLSSGQDTIELLLLLPPTKTTQNVILKFENVFNLTTGRGTSYNDDDGIIVIADFNPFEVILL